MSVNQHRHDYNAAAARFHSWAGRPVSFTISHVRSGGREQAMVAMFSGVEICRVVSRGERDTDLEGDGVEVVLGVAGREIGSIFVEEPLLDETVSGWPFDLDLGLGKIWLTVTDETPEVERGVIPRARDESPL